MCVCVCVCVCVVCVCVCVCVCALEQGWVGGGGGCRGICMHDLKMVGYTSVGTDLSESVLAVFFSFKTSSTGNCYPPPPPPPRHPDWSWTTVTNSPKRRRARSKPGLLVPLPRLNHNNDSPAYLHDWLFLDRPARSVITAWKKTINLPCFWFDWHNCYLALSVPGRGMTKLWNYSPMCHQFVIGC